MQKNMLDLAEYKRRFIDFLIQADSLKVNPSNSEGDWTLKSGRTSPHFVNIGDVSDGDGISQLGKAYAEAIKATEIDFDLVYGIPEKGVGLAIAAATSLAELGINKGWFFTRKEAKAHGEATGAQSNDIKPKIVGRAPKDGNIIIQLDDVFTAGDAKYEARKVLDSLGQFNLPLLAIAVDRQEVGIDGENAIEKYVADTGTKVTAIITAAEIYKYLSSLKDHEKAAERIARYLRVYGTKKAKEDLGLKPLEQRIIETDRSVIPACDVPFEEFGGLIKSTSHLPKIGGYKIPATSGRKGWERWVETARKHTNKPLIYDHQKAGTDIPDTAKEFMKELRESGIDTVILFPQAGPETERAWIYHALDQELKVIVGGRMTHKGYAQSEGGFITDEGAMEMYKIAARAGISDFVVPGNKPEVVKQIKEIIEAEGVSPIFYAPGFVAQGGKISDTARVAGSRFHGIVGRGIYRSSDKELAAIEHCSQL
ncbi:orotidine 5'-phosphate decarboxylase [Candidatus Woesearchaeota archaeon]|nr:orotidine 5'-phosphate decarboxylase [Candidatus Woesearchaeota archaeon]